MAGGTHTSFSGRCWEAGRKTGREGEARQATFVNGAGFHYIVCFEPGILMALFLDNVGGAWDNAKK